MNLPYDNNYIIINMDETPCSLEMGLKTTIDFKKKDRYINIRKRKLSNTIILSVAGNGYKLLLY